MPLKFDDLELAFMFANGGPLSEESAYVNPSTGEIYYESETTDLHEVPDDVSWDELIEVPHRHDLDLGQRLVWRFVNQHLPDRYDDVREIFSRRGAYGRFKAFLDRLGRLDDWHRFEASATTRALREWCEAEGIELASEEPESG